MYVACLLNLSLFDMAIFGDELQKTLLLIMKYY
jgi:hypothetical protein